MISQKKRSLFFLLFLSTNIFYLNAQVLKFIPNPDNGKGVRAGFSIWNNQLFMGYTKRSDSNCIAFFDGKILKTLTTPKDLSYISIIGSYMKDFSAVYNDKIYFQGSDKLIEFNSDTFRIIPNPINTQYSGYYGGFDVYKKKLFINYRNGYFGFQLAEFDGNSIKLIQNYKNYKTYGVIGNYKEKLLVPLDYGSDKIGIGIYDGKNWSEIDFSKISMGIGFRGEIIKNNDSLFFPFFGSPNLVTYNGENVKVYPHPVIGIGIDYGSIFFKINNQIFFNYRTIYKSSSSDQPRHQFGTLINDSIVLISNPDEGEGPSTNSYYNRGSYFPTKFRNEIYFRYYNKTSNAQLAKFDGKKITLIDNPINTKSLSNESGRFLVYQNGLFMIFTSINNKNLLYRYDGFKFTLIQNPDLGSIPNYPQFICFQNSLYLNYLNSDGINVLAEYTEPNTLTPPSITINKNIFCEGDSILVNSDKNSGNIWYLNDIEIENETKQSFYIKEGGYYSVAYRNANLEVSPKSIPVKITKQINYNIPIITTNDSVNICAGSTISFKSSIKNNIQWFKDNVAFKTNNDSIIITNLPGRYYATNQSSGCFSDTSNNIIIKYKSTPSKPQFNTSNFSFCQGDTLKLSIINLNKKDTLKWFFGNKIDSSNTSSKFFLDTAKVFVLKKDSLNCFISSDTISLVKKQLPSSPIVSRDTSNNLVSNYLNSNIWFKDGLIISDTSRKFKPTIQGSYTVKTIQNGCTSLISSPYYYLITDLINLSSTEFIKLVPNPFVSQLNFDFTIKGYPRLNLDIFDIITGGLLISKQGLYAGSSIMLTQLSAGSYIFRVSSSDGKISHQFKMVKM